jgi:hypothetical protein
MMIMAAATLGTAAGAQAGPKQDAVVAKIDLVEGRYAALIDRVDMQYEQKVITQAQWRVQKMQLLAEERAKLMALRPRLQNAIINETRGY